MTQKWKIGIGVALVVIVAMCIFSFLYVVPRLMVSTSSSGVTSAGVGMEPAGRSGYGYASEAAESPAMPPGAQADFAEATKSTGGAAALPQERMVIKTAALSIVVKDVRSAVQMVAEYALKNNGFVVESTVAKEELAPYGSITVRLPAKVFDTGLSGVRALGDVKSEQSNGQDVTDQYVDLEARFHNLQATEVQLLSIMKRSGTIPDVLAVQRELTAVRSQIEQLQGQIKYLEQSVALSTITVNFSTDPAQLPVVDGQTDKWQLQAVVKSALRGLLAVAKVVANVIIWFVILVPVWLFIVLIIWLSIKLWYRFRQRNRSV